MVHLSLTCTSGVNLSVLARWVARIAIIPHEYDVNRHVCASNDGFLSYTDLNSSRPSEFNPPTGWNTGANSGSGSTSQQKSAASGPLRAPLLFRLLASSFGTGARPHRIARPSVPSSQLDSEHPTLSNQTANTWPPGAVPSNEGPPTTTEIPADLLTRLLAIVPRAPVETPPTEFLPYPPPPDYVWPAGQTPQNENPKPSENSPGGWYGGTGQTQGQGAGSTNGQTPIADNGAVASGDAKGGDHKPNIGMIVGIVLGVPAFLLLCWFVWWKLKIRKRKKEALAGEKGGEEGDGGTGDTEAPEHAPESSATESTEA